MILLHQEDLHHVVSNLPKDVREQLQLGKIFLGGGFIRALVARETPKDIDLFGQSKEQLKESADLILAQRNRGRIHTSENAFTLLEPGRTPVQFITKWLYDDPYDLVRSFDFTVCQAVVWHSRNDEKWYGVAADNFYVDLASKRLRYTQPVRKELAGGSMMRVLKYLQRGYVISPEDMAKVMDRCVAGIAQETGVDTWKVIAGRLREVDPLRIVDGIEMNEEDHV